jgi:hypothetical protein
LHFAAKKSVTRNTEGGEPVQNRPFETSGTGHIGIRVDRIEVT